MIQKFLLSYITGLINGVDWNSGINARNVLMGVNIKF